MDKNTETIFEVFNILEETKPISTYLKLIVWMKENEIEQEDLALAFEIFLLINK